MDHSTITAGTSNRIAETEKPSHTVVETVADAEGIDPTELDPLYETIDPDSLDELFQDRLRRVDAPATAGAVTFAYHGYEVRVTAGGRVSLEDA